MSVLCTYCLQIIRTSRILHVAFTFRVGWSPISLTSQFIGLELAGRMTWLRALVWSRSVHRNDFLFAYWYDLSCLWLSCGEATSKTAVVWYWLDVCNAAIVRVCVCVCVMFRTFANQPPVFTISFHFREIPLWSLDWDIPLPFLNPVYEPKSTVHLLTLAFTITWYQPKK